MTNQATSTQRSEPLGIGILGAARIAELSMIGPARATGHRVVAVAARNPDRAKAFATRYGVDRAHVDYQGMLDDPDVEVVYNALVNSEHARWNIAALQAGKHVLSEKPFTANADQAMAVRGVAAASSGRIVEGFHSCTIRSPSGCVRSSRPAGSGNYGTSRSTCRWPPRRTTTHAGRTNWPGAP